MLRPLWRTTIHSAICIGVLACGSGSPAATCDIESLIVTFVGTIDVRGTSTPVALTGPYSNAVISRENFAYLAEVLGRGAATGGASAVWGVTGGPNAMSLHFQLGGVRSPGSSLPIFGVLTQGLAPGRGPPISALPRDGLYLLFGSDDYLATSGSGTLAVQTAAPLRGTLEANLLDAAGEQARLSGEVSVQVTGPGCNSSRAASRALAVVGRAALCARN